MPTVVDGSNFGGRVAGRRGARDPQLVLGWVLAWARRRRARVTVVFDGPPAEDVATSYGSVTVRFAGGRTADAVILELAARAPRSTRVVTEDRELAERCRGLGCTVVPAAQILADARPGDEPKGVHGPIDVADWEAWFRGEGE